MLQHCIPWSDLRSVCISFQLLTSGSVFTAVKGSLYSLVHELWIILDRKRREKRITRKLHKHTQTFFHPLEAFPDWPFLWKGNQVKHGKGDAAILCSHSSVIYVEFWSSLSSPAPLLFIVHTDLSTPLCIVLAGLDRLHFCGTADQVKVFPRMDGVLSHSVRNGKT